MKPEVVRERRGVRAVGGYADLVACLGAIMDGVAEQGVTVIPEACASDLAHLFGRFRVVSVVAHGLFPLLKPADLLHPQAILGALQGTVGDAAMTDAREQVVMAMRRDRALREVKSIQELIRAFRLRMQRGEGHYRRHDANDGGEPFAAGTAFGTDPSWLPWTMAILYEAFPEAVRPPAVFELSDGPLDFEQLVSAVPEDFAGTIEYLICRALWFAEPFCRRRPTCLDIISPKRLAGARVRLTLYRHVIRLIAHRPMRYADAVRAIHYAAGYGDCASPGPESGPRCGGG